MKKKILWIFAVVVIVFGWSLNAVAQPLGPPGGTTMRGGVGGFDIGQFFRNPEFVKMLEFTPDQITELQKVGEEIRAQVQTQMQNIPRPEPGNPPSPQEMEQRAEQMRKIMETVQDDVQARVSKVLKPEQMTKAREVTFQLSGGLNSPVLGVRTLETLNLTDTQKEQVRKIMAERDTENRSIMQGFDRRNATPEEWEKFRTEMEARNKKYTEQVAALLTPEQKAKAEKLTAEAPALREKLGIPAPGQPGQRVQGQQRGQQGGGYAPGAQSWRPGQDVPNTPSQQPSRPGNFPRPSGN